MAARKSTTNGATALKRKAAEQHVKNLERALKDERTGLVAVARACLEECPEPSRLMRRLEAMARQAEVKREPARVREAIAYGHDVLKRAAEQVQGTPQGLFSPHVGHVSKERVDEIVTAETHQQIGFGFSERDPLSDVKDQGQERSAGEQAIRDTIIACLKEKGALTDHQLEAEYRRRARPLTLTVIRDHRKELTRRGRVARDGSDGGEPSWTLMESRVIL